jgi:uncharacterized membrane protein (DUF4010 family)
MNTETEFFRLGLALALGLLIGLERGWHDRTAAEGERTAGLRTFGLISLAGGLWALLAGRLADVVLAASLLGFMGLIVLSHWTRVQRRHDVGLTTEVAALIAFGVGALAATGEPTVAAALAVVTTAVLGAKPVVHGWLTKLDERELRAIVQLLLISVVALPLLPNRGFGPWDAWNPYEIWWLVVLVTAISFAGYFAVRITGEHRGLGLTALLGGLVSSTAVTLSYARLGRSSRAAPEVLAAGVLLANGTMFARTWLVAFILEDRLAATLGAALGAMWVVCLAGAGWHWRAARAAARVRSPAQTDEPALRNPFEIRAALQLALLLMVITALARGLREQFGDPGIYALAAVSGIVDVDPVTLSLARQARADLALEVAGLGILIASFVNTAVKGAAVYLLGTARLGHRVAPTLAVAIAVGALAHVLATALANGP